MKSKVDCYHTTNKHEEIVPEHWKADEKAKKVVADPGYLSTLLPFILVNGIYTLRLPAFLSSIYKKNAVNNMLALALLLQSWKAACLLVLTDCSLAKLTHRRRNLLSLCLFGNLHHRWHPEEFLHFLSLYPFFHLLHNSTLTLTRSPTQEEASFPLGSQWHLSLAQRGEKLPVLSRLLHWHCADNWHLRNIKARCGFNA